VINWIANQKRRGRGRREAKEEYQSKVFGSYIPPPPSLRASRERYGKLSLFGYDRGIQGCHLCERIEIRRRGRSLLNVNFVLLLVLFSR